MVAVFILVEAIDTGVIIGAKGVGLANDVSRPRWDKIMLKSQCRHSHIRTPMRRLWQLAGRGAPRERITTGAYHCGT